MGILFAFIRGLKIGEKWEGERSESAEVGLLRADGGADESPCIVMLMIDSELRILYL